MREMMKKKKVFTIVSGIVSMAMMLPVAEVQAAGNGKNWLLGLGEYGETEEFLIMLCFAGLVVFLGMLFMKKPTEKKEIQQQTVGSDQWKPTEPLMKVDDYTPTEPLMKVDDYTPTEPLMEVDDYTPTEPLMEERIDEYEPTIPIGVGRGPYEPQPQKVYVQILDGELEKQEYEVTEHPVVIGWAEDATIRYSKEKGVISERHCRIFWYEGVLRVIDLGSEYGTYLERTGRLPANVPMPMMVGDLLYLGNQTHAMRVVLK